MAAQSEPPSINGGNALAALLAAAKASMQRQRQQQLNHQNNHQEQQQQQQQQPSTLQPTPSPLGTRTIDHDSAAKLIASLVNRSKSVALNDANNATTATTTTTTITNTVQRPIESWNDPDGGVIEYQDLVDPSSSNGWSAEEMFRYNEKIHKITSNYCEKTLPGNYTTPLPKISSKSALKMASQLAKEIEDRVIAEGRITPESSDDDEYYENDRLQRLQAKQRMQQPQQHQQQPQQQQQHKNQTPKWLQDLCPTKVQSSNQHKHSNGRSATTTTMNSPPKHSNCNVDTITAPLTSSPIHALHVVKPLASSSRNILRTCLT